MTSLGHTLAALKRRARAFEQPASATAGLLRDGGAFAPNPGTLTMKVHTPAALPPGAPLVVVLHGCGQTAEGYASGAGWITLADRFGFALLCPEQTRSNNANLCFNWFEPADSARAGGEAASIAAMVRHRLAQHDLDPTRVYVTGLSAGGAMAGALLATWPELFAGGAIIAGLPYGSARSMSEAFMAMNQSRTLTPGEAGDAVRAASGHCGPWPPVSIWQGQADTVVRPSAADALVRQWTDVHGVAGGPVTARTPQGRDFQVWLSPTGDPVVELHRIPGMGHGTPLDTGGVDGSGVAGPYLLDVGISSSLEIALGWGIATAGGAGRRERPAAAAAPGTSEGPSARPSIGITAVIEQALRSAGLMR